MRRCEVTLGDGTKQEGTWLHYYTKECWSMVETDDGKVRSVDPESIRFLSPIVSQEPVFLPLPISGPSDDELMLRLTCAVTGTLGDGLYVGEGTDSARMAVKVREHADAMRIEFRKWQAEQTGGDDDAQT